MFNPYRQEKKAESIRLKSRNRSHQDMHYLYIQGRAYYLYRVIKEYHTIRNYRYCKGIIEVTKRNIQMY